LVHTPRLLLALAAFTLGVHTCGPMLGDDRAPVGRDISLTVRLELPDSPPNQLLERGLGRAVHVGHGWIRQGGRRLAVLRRGVTAVWRIFEAR
jgi:hypothetical protein